MATTIRDLLVRLGVEADTGAVQKFDNALGTARNTMLAASGAAAALLGGIGALVRETALYGDEVAKTAPKIGVNTQELQELHLAAKVAGASQQQLTVGMKTQARTVFDALNGSTELAKIYSNVLPEGIKLSEVAQKGQIATLKAVAEGLSGMEDGYKKTTFVQKILGEEGVALIPLLNGGAAGIDNMAARARELGFILDAEAIRASEEFNDKLTTTSLVFQGLRQQIGAAFLPVFNELLGGLEAGLQIIRPWLTATIEFIDNTIGMRVVIGGLLAVLGSLGVLLGATGLLFLITSVIGAIGTLTAGVTALTAATGIGLLPLLLLAGLAFLQIGTVVVLLSGYFIALGLIIEDLVVFAQGGDSAFGALLTRLRETPGVVGEVTEFMVGLFGIFNELVLIVPELKLFLFDLAGEGFGLLNEASQAFNLQLLTLLGNVTGVIPGFDLRTRFANSSGDAIDRTTGLTRGLNTALTVLKNLLPDVSIGDLSTILPNISGGIASGRQALADRRQGNQTALGFAGEQGARAAAGGASVTVNGGTQVITTGSAAETVQAIQQAAGARLRQAKAALSGREY